MSHVEMSVGYVNKTNRIDSLDKLCKMKLKLGSTKKANNLYSTY